MSSDSTAWIGGVRRPGDRAFDRLTRRPDDAASPSDSDYVGHAIELIFDPDTGTLIGRRGGDLLGVVATGPRTWEAVWFRPGRDTLGKVAKFSPRSRGVPFRWGGE